MRLSELERPFICTSIAATTIKETVTAMKRAEYDGARAFEVHLPLLGFPDPAPLARLTDATAAPVYATCRRGAFYELLGADVTVDVSDDERAERLLAAVEAGCDGVDLELDAFDPTGGPDAFNPAAIDEYAADSDASLAEVTDDADAVDRQQEFVQAVHDRAADVMLSAHTYRHLEPADAVGIAERMTDRGADFCKIVGVDRDLDEALDTIEGHLHLNDADVAPYSLMAIGDPSRILRPLSPMLGSAWVFAQPDLRPDGFHSWPLVENVREVLRRVDWRSVHDPHYA
jgi:3-dehydroquinate dehydratase